jgi:hypothetical protein
VSEANQITRRNRGHNVETVIGELQLYVRGWLNYYMLSSTFSEVKALSVWVRRRVRLYYWKQWKAMSGGHSFKSARRVLTAWPCGRQATAHAPCNMLALGADPATVHMATRSRKGYWRMSQNEIARFAMNNRWLEEQGVSDVKAIWTVLHYGPKARA